MSFKRGLAAALLFLVAGCTTLSPDSISDSDINAEAAREYAKVKAQTPISRNSDWTRMVQRVANRIARASGENFDWEVVLLESKEVNAWCMPGGKMAVYTGIMPVLQTEGALAAVMGHEVAHATRRHGKAKLARGMQQQLTGALIGLGAGIIASQYCESDRCRTVAQLGGTLGGLGVAFFSLRYDRDAELEADQDGQIFMARAGYDPAESVKLWERMAAAGGGDPPEFMSTHPSEANRRGRLLASMARAQSEYAQAADKFGIGEAIR